MTDELRLDRAEHALRRGKELLPLTEKPWRLLLALIEQRGHIVEREDLYRAIWPETEHLDFDANLNATVRKLRAALGDSASSPRWIQTVPGRGYRLLPLTESAPETRATDDPAVVLLPSPSTPCAAEGSTGSGRPRGPRKPLGPMGPLELGALVLAFGAAIAWWSLSLFSMPPERARLGIVRFERTALGTPREAALARIGEEVLAALADRLRDRADVLGPRSTHPFEDHPFPRLRDLREELDLDYVLNARLVVDDTETALIVELIRLEDGAHPWVEAWSSFQDPEAIRRATVEGVTAVLEAPATVP